MVRLNGVRFIVKNALVINIKKQYIINGIENENQEIILKIVFQKINNASNILTILELRLLHYDPAVSVMTARVSF